MDESKWEHGKDEILNIIGAPSPAANEQDMVQLDAALSAASTFDEKKEVFRAALGGGVDAAEIATLCDIADRAAKIALTEMITVAESMGADSVPVAVLKEAAAERSILSLLLWQAVEELDLNIVTSTDVPDDLSEIFGES